MTAVQWFSAGIGYLLIALALAVLIFGGSALFLYRRDRRRLEEQRR